MKRSMLNDVAAHFASWNYTICKRKMIYDTFNKFDYDVRRKVFVADAWAPESRVYDVYKTLEQATARAGVETKPVLNLISTKATPPTHLPVNKMCYGFQALVNTYGTPRYREVNAGAFAVILFPFLFGIMFGDLGHGTLLMLFGLGMIRYESHFEGKKLDDLFEMCYGGRYVIFLNGLFGMYVGLIYNEIFACPMSIFGSGYDWDNETILHPPIFGVEPAWHHAANKISFFNSFKMKISIIVGVGQMMFGLVLSLLNHLEFKDYKKVLFQFLPEVGFFGSIFGYLIFLIFYKWSVPWVALGRPAPSLLTTLINMFMSPGAVALPENKDLLLFEGQADVEQVLILIALVCVPLLLFPIPFIEQCHHEAEIKKKEEAYARLTDEGRAAEDSHAHVHAEGEHEFSFGDIFVHQAIHTIEFVLGSISNTASYLRLWALSLAHSQLSELFWDDLLVRGARATRRDNECNAPTRLRMRAPCAHRAAAPAASSLRARAGDGRTLERQQVHVLDRRDHVAGDLLHGADGDGEPLLLPARAPPAVGRVPGQVLLGRRHQVQPLRLQDHRPGRGRLGDARPCRVSTTPAVNRAASSGRDARLLRMRASWPLIAPHATADHSGPPSHCA
jgi:V-type H+-transporting ATPase subunit a